MIDVIQGVGIFIIFLIIFYLTYDTNINRLNYVDNKKKRTISFLSYNVKRLTLQNKPINFINWDKSDIVCLQEYYNDNHGKKKFNLHKSVNFNIVLPPNYTFLKDSGLVILSKFPIIYVDYVKFKLSCSNLSFINRGFLVVKIRKLYIINTYLCGNVASQLEQIYNYINLFLKDKNIIIMGGFSKNIFSIKGFSEFTKIYSKVPTMWQNNDTYPIKTTNKLKDDMIPRWEDGALVKTDKHQIKNIMVEDMDINSIHLGISFELEKMK